VRTPRPSRKRGVIPHRPPRRLPWPRTPGPPRLPDRERLCLGPPPELLPTRPETRSSMSSAALMVREVAGFLPRPTTWPRISGRGRGRIPASLYLTRTGSARSGASCTSQAVTTSARPIRQAPDAVLLIPPPPPPHAGRAEIDRGRDVAEPLTGLQPPDHPESPHGGKAR
jgi:hypothetical protein